MNMVSTTQMIGESPASADKPREQEPVVAPHGAAAPEPDKPLDPTRFGDWEKNGRCIDF